MSVDGGFVGRHSVKVNISAHPQREHERANSDGCRGPMQHTISRLCSSERACRPVTRLALSDAFRANVPMGVATPPRSSSPRASSPIILQKHIDMARFAECIPAYAPRTRQRGMHIRAHFLESPVSNERHSPLAPQLQCTAVLLTGGFLLLRPPLRRPRRKVSERAQCSPQLHERIATPRSATQLPTRTRSR